MSMIYILSWAFLLSGSFFLVVGGVGLLRLPDFYTRIHAAGMVDTLGAPLILVGLCIQAGWSLNTVKMLLILGFLLLASATTGHALAKAAFAHGLKPLLHDESKTGAGLSASSDAAGGEVKP